MEHLTYRGAGVDIDAGNKAVQLIKSDVEKTFRPEVLGGLGGFGGLFRLDISKYKDPVLVSGTDGVGTKLRLAFLWEKHDTIGQDAVAMCVNDILVQGAEPLFFLDYLAVGSLDPEQVAEVVKGVARACSESGCALIGGETAEMAGFYAKGEYDIAGFAVGVVERDKLITPEKVHEGDVLIGLSSSGIHSNGYSLVRQIIFEREKLYGNEFIDELGKSISEELLTPTRLYPRICLPLIQKFDIHGMVHITGGGFYENIPRALPKDLGARIDGASWKILPIFKLLQEWGSVEWHEMFRTFNMGIGMILIVDPKDVDAIRSDLDESFVIGKVEKNPHHEVIIEGGVFA